MKKNFLQLSFSDVMLHFKYKVLLYEPEIEFNNLAGGKARETDYRNPKPCDIFSKAYLIFIYMSKGLRGKIELNVSRLASSSREFDPHTSTRLRF